MQPRHLSLAVVAVLGALGAPALAQNAPPSPPQIAGWDAHGWVYLGERTVDRHVDHDRIAVGRVDGHYAKLQVVVLDSDLEMIDMNIKFGDNTEYHPELKQVFKEGQRTRGIQMPPAEHVIKFVEFKYRNTPGGGRARVQLWGLPRDGAPAAPPAPPPVVETPVDTTGWTVLGERTVDGRYDHDKIDVPRYDGKFTKLKILVTDSDLELVDFAVKFGRGAPWRPGFKHFFKQGQRSRDIDLPGDDRVIKTIELRYRNLPGGGRAKVQILGKPAEVAAKPWKWDSRGWQLLGERTVDGRVDSDKIEVGRYQGRFRRLAIVVTDSDLELIDFAIKFKKGEPYHPELRQFFKEGSRSKEIDFPGDERVIKWIEFKYANLPGGGKARIQVWGR